MYRTLESLHSAQEKMATTNTDAFPVNDTDYSVVDPAVNTLLKNLITRSRMNKMMTNLKHMVSIPMRLRIKQVQEVR